MNALKWQPGDLGIFPDIPEDVYRSAPGVNVSLLKEARLSLAHYAHRMATPQEETAALRIGRLVHRAVLEPEKLAGSYVVRPAEFSDYRSKAAQAWRDAQTLPVLTQDESDNLNQIAEAVWRVPLVREMLPLALKEVSAFKHHRTGMMLKGRADAFVESIENVDCLRWIFDVKTVPYGGASMDEFARQIALYDYHQQAAFYLDLFDAHRFVFIVVEKEAPHGVALYEADPEDIALGRRMNEGLLKQIADAVSKAEWPSYPTNIRNIQMPAWKRRLEGQE